MATTMIKEQDLSAAVDTLTALEQRVVRAIELLNRERERRADIEQQLSALRDKLEAEQSISAALRHELDELHRERDTVRNRVERLMESLDALESA